MNANIKDELISHYFFLQYKFDWFFKHKFIPFFRYPNKSLLNPFGYNIQTNLYVIDINWINNFKSQTNYDHVKKILEDMSNFEDENEIKKEIKEKLENMKLTEEIKNSESKLPPMNNQSYGRTFFNKLILNRDALDCLVDEKTFELFKKYSHNYSTTFKIKGYILDKIIFFIFESMYIIKILFYKEKEDIIQIIADFNETLNINSKSSNILNSNFNLAPDEKGYKLILFENKIWKTTNSQELIDEFIKINFDIFDKDYSFMKTQEIHYSLKKCNYKDLFESNLERNEINLNSEHLPKLVGLRNVGATCYMNATLQCLINTKSLTKYLLNEFNFTTIMNNCNLYELTSSYCEVLSNCCRDNIIYYKPKKFKEILSEKNPLFSGIQANDSKDLVDFLLEEMNNELKQLEFAKSSIDNINFNYSNIDHSNKELSLNYFKLMTQKQNKSIISKTFYILTENLTTYLSCNEKKYNYQVMSYLEFFLQTVYDFSKQDKNTQNSKKRRVDLYTCFLQYYEPTNFNGNNQIYCQTCKKQEDGINFNKLYSLPPTLILTFNRGIGNSYDCIVDFPQTLNLEPFVQNKTNYIYELKGVITHLGASGITGHYIAYIRHCIDGKWYCYNDSTVTLCNNQENDFNNGTPYILFYQSTNGENNFLFDESNLTINNNNNFMANNNFNNIFDNNNNLMKNIQMNLMNDKNLINMNNSNNLNNQIIDFNNNNNTNTNRANQINNMSNSRNCITSRNNMNNINNMNGMNNFINMNNINNKNNSNSMGNNMNLMNSMSNRDNMKNININKMNNNINSNNNLNNMNYMININNNNNNIKNLNNSNNMNNDMNNMNNNMNYMNIMNKNMSNNNKINDINNMNNMNNMSNHINNSNNINNLNNMNVMNKNMNFFNNNNKMDDMNNINKNMNNNCVNNILNNVNSMNKNMNNMNNNNKMNDTNDINKNMNNNIKMNNINNNYNMNTINNLNNNSKNNINNLNNINNYMSNMNEKNNINNINNNIDNLNKMNSMNNNNKIYSNMNFMNNINCINNINNMNDMNYQKNKNNMNSMNNSNPNSMNNYNDMNMINNNMNRNFLNDMNNNNNFN